MSNAKKTPKTPEELQATLQALIAQGKKDGVIHASELSAQLESFDLTAERIEEIWQPHSDTSIILDRHSNALHLIQRLRDEAHRFAITHHRSLRTKASVASRLDSVPGVGPTRRKNVLKHFKTVEALKAATVEEIAEVPGLPQAVAENIWNTLHAEEEKKTPE